jgi:hypothetical protein
MKKILFLLFSVLIVGSLSFSCGKDKETEKKATVLEGSGTWNNPFKVSVGTTMTKIEPGSYLYEFPYSIGQAYTIKLSRFTQDLDLRVVVGYGPNQGNGLTSSTNGGLDEEELTYEFSQSDLYLHIENLEEEATDFTLSIVKN